MTDPYDPEGNAGMDGVQEQFRSCTCHPDDNPPVPCQHKYALSDCRLAASSKGPASMREGDGVMAALKNVVAAWEALPGGDHRYHVVEQWLRYSMKPAIDTARAAILSATKE